LLLLFCCCSFVFFVCGYEGNFALSFDGSNDFVLISHEVTDRNVEDFWTLEAWIKADKLQNQLGQVNQQNIIGFPKRHPNLELCGPSADHSNSNCEEGVILTQVRDSNGKYYLLSGKKQVNDNKWHHVAATWDNNTLSIYIDGVLDTTSKPYENGYKSSMKCLDTCPNGFQIGGFFLNNLAIQFFRGVIDEVRVWSGARTQREIISTMSQTVLSSETNLLYNWRFDEAIGGIVDSRGFPAPGTLGGGVTNYEPRWIESSAPITARRDRNSIWNFSISGRYYLAGFIALISFLVGLVFGFLIIRYKHKIPLVKKRCFQTEITYLRMKL